MIQGIYDIFQSSILNPPKIMDSGTIVEKEKQVQEETSTPDVEVDITNGSNKQINNLISKEDEISKRLNTAQNIYNMLGEIRLELAGLVKTLKNTDIEHDISSLEELSHQSDNLIEKAINIVKNDNVTGIANSSLTNSYLKGLSSIKDLKISGAEYITQLENILKDVKNEENNYYKLTQTLYSGINSLSSEYDNLAANNTQNNKTNPIKAELLQRDIIKDFRQTLVSKSQELSKDILLNLL